MTIGGQAIVTLIDYSKALDSITDISNILALLNYRTCERTHRYGETKNVRTNHPVEGSVHPSCTENGYGVYLYGRFCLMEQTLGL